MISPRSASDRLRPESKFIRNDQTRQSAMLPLVTYEDICKPLNCNLHHAQFADHIKIKNTISIYSFYPFCSKKNNNRDLFLSHRSSQKKRHQPSPTNHRNSWGFGTHDTIATCIVNIASNGTPFKLCCINGAGLSLFWKSVGLSFCFSVGLVFLFGGMETTRQRHEKVKWYENKL